MVISRVTSLSLKASRILGLGGRAPPAGSAYRNPPPPGDGGGGAQRERRGAASGLGQLAKGVPAPVAGARESAKRFFFRGAAANRSNFALRQLQRLQIGLFMIPS